MEYTDFRVRQMEKTKFNRKVYSNFRDLSNLMRKQLTRDITLYRALGTICDRETVIEKQYGSWGLGIDDVCQQRNR